MRFPAIEQLALPATFARYVPGALHPDGRRYLPQLIFKLADKTLIGVVDRHHYVDPELVGRTGTVQLVYLLSRLALQPPGEQRQGIVGEPHASRVSTAPPAWGRVAAVHSWELRRGVLPFETMFTELRLDVGAGTVGVRSSMNAPNIAAALGAERFELGDWIAVARSRIDVLGFEPGSADDA